MSTTVTRRRYSDSLDTFRRRARMPSRHEVHQIDNIALSNPKVPNRIPPGDRVTAAVDLRNNNFVILPTDPNQCDPPNAVAPFSVGQQLKVELKVNGSVVDSDQHCVQGSGSQWTFNGLEWTPPQVDTQRTFNLEWTATLVNSGELADSISQTVTVAPGAEPAPGPTDPTDEGPFDFLSSISDLLGSTENALIILGIFALILFALAVVR